MEQTSFKLLFFEIQMEKLRMPKFFKVIKQMQNCNN